jgi:chloramphenicol 3-O phosphotransferase
MSQITIIFLNGASSSGKTTLGRALQQALDEPYFYFSSDQLVEANVLPAVDRQAQDGEWAWRTIRPRFFDGFHRCIAALASGGNCLIVEHVLEFQPWFDDCVQLLAPFDVFFVGVQCPLEELERRERERGDRTIGEGRSHLLEGVHTWGEYDFEIDTSLYTPESNAQRIKAAFASRSRPGAFQRAHEQNLRSGPISTASTDHLLLPQPQPPDEADD